VPRPWNVTNSVLGTGLNTTTWNSLYIDAAVKRRETG
jgi:hypothetical protein